MIVAVGVRRVFAGIEAVAVGVVVDARLTGPVAVVVEPVAFVPVVNGLVEAAHLHDAVVADRDVERPGVVARALAVSQVYEVARHVLEDLGDLGVRVDDAVFVGIAVAIHAARGVVADVEIARGPVVGHCVLATADSVGVDVARSVGVHAVDSILVAAAAIEDEKLIVVSDLDFVDIGPAGGERRHRAVGRDLPQRVAHVRREHVAEVVKGDAVGVATASAADHREVGAHVALGIHALDRRVGRRCDGVDEAIGAEANVGQLAREGAEVVGELGDVAVYIELTDVPAAVPDEVDIAGGGVDVDAVGGPIRREVDPSDL